MNPKEKIIVALDTPDLKKAEELLTQLRGAISFYKVGFELFYAQGWKAVELVEKYGGKVFLDLKLHDIPNTVKNALKMIAEHPVAMVNVHCLGGLDMMRAAVETLQEHQKNQKILLIGVTILTSLTPGNLSKELGIEKPFESQAIALAVLAKRAGLDGVVSSPQEISALRKECGKDFVIVTPGIRPEGAALNDQKRILTPKQAFQAGADYLVIGRPITHDQNPHKAVMDIIQSISAAEK